MKKVIAFCGSPHRQGDTAAMLREVLRGAESEEAETRLIQLNDLNMKGCQGCMACQRNGGTCVTEDDLKPLLEEIRRADGVVLGTPIYMWQMSSQLKTLVDRFYCFLDVAGEFRSRLVPPKRTVLVFAQKFPDKERFRPYFQTTAEFLQVMGFSVERTISAVTWGMKAPGETRGQADLMGEAFEAGRALAQ
jgi:hypothetical protein